MAHLLEELDKLEATVDSEEQEGISEDPSPEVLARLEPEANRLRARAGAVIARLLARNPKKLGEDHVKRGGFGPNMQRMHEAQLTAERRHAEDPDVDSPDLGALGVEMRV